MIKILHFADAHIDMAAHGKLDPQSGLPVRVNDFLRALDTIVDTAVSEKVDLVIFAGDTYKDRSPSPTYQREWGKRIIRLSQANILTLLLVGNHDLSPASGRANTMQEYDTLQMPHVHVLSRPEFLKPADLEGLPLQVLSLPWIFRSAMMAALELSASKPDELKEQLENTISNVLRNWLQELDPTLPTILTAHGSIQGAMYGNERSIMLGKDLLLPGDLLRNPRLDYVALGHIHKSQDVNQGSYPPIIYPGSIERVDFGEAGDKKYFSMVNLERGKTTYEFRLLKGRPFIDRAVSIAAGDDVMQKIKQALPAREQVQDAIVRFVIDYPREMDPFIDEPFIREHCSGSLEFHLLKRPQQEARLRLPENQTLTSLSPQEMLDLYWNSIHTKTQDRDSLHELAREIIQHTLSREESREAGES
jgi:exonuclease SbcD